MDTAWGQRLKLVKSAEARCRAPLRTTQRVSSRKETCFLPCALCLLPRQSRAAAGAWPLCVLASACWEPLCCFPTSCKSLAQGSGQQSSFSS